MTDSRQEFREILHHFNNAMLVTRTREGEMRARPMLIARAEPDGDLWFFTKLDSGKIEEILHEPRCAAIMQGPFRFLSISGRAEIIQSRPKIDSLWKRGFEVWFEDGQDEPDLALIHFVADEAEYWDGSGTKGLRYVFEMAKAFWRGGSVEPEALGGHAHIML